MNTVGRNTVGGNSLKSIIDRVENLEQQRKELGQDISEIFKDAKNQGFNTKVIRKIIALRKKSAADRAKEEVLMDTYMNAIGMTPIEKAIADADRSA